MNSPLVVCGDAITASFVLSAHLSVIADQRLERDTPLQLALPREINHTHATSTEFAFNRVVIKEALDFSGVGVASGDGTVSIIKNPHGYSIHCSLEKSTQALPACMFSNFTINLKPFRLAQPKPIWLFFPHVSRPDYSRHPNLVFIFGAGGIARRF